MTQSQHGRQSRVAEAAKNQLRGWLAEQRDKTLAELREDLQTSNDDIRRIRISRVLQQMSLERKKRCTPPSATRKQALEFIRE